MSVPKGLDDAYGLVYVLTNAVNGKQYVGQTIYSVDERWAGHVRVSTSSRRKNQPVTLAIAKYGPGAFTRQVLQSCGDQEELNNAELSWVLRLNTFTPTGYNIMAGGGGSGKMSAERRKRLSDDFPKAERERLSKLYAGRPWSPLAYKRAAAATRRAAEKRTGSVWIRDPSGQLQWIESQQRHCDVTKLQYSNFLGVVRGRRTSCSDWHLIDWRAVVAVAGSLGSRQYSCPTCASVWTSPSQRHANQHATACARSLAMITEAHALGNVTDTDLDNRLNELKVPRKMQHNRVRKWRPLTTLLSPDGEYHQISNMKEFCLDYGLQASHMSRLVNGHVKSYKGWTLSGHEVSNDKETG